MGAGHRMQIPGCIMPTMASSGQGSERLNAQLLVDSIPALIHTARPDGYLDYFNNLGWNILASLWIKWPAGIGTLTFTPKTLTGLWPSGEPASRLEKC